MTVTISCRTVAVISLSLAFGQTLPGTDFNDHSKNKTCCLYLLEGLNILFSPTTPSR
jgi:hypothetical protein